MMPLTRAERIATLTALFMGAVLLAFLAGLWVGSRHATPPNLPLPPSASPIAEITPATLPLEATPGGEPSIPTSNTDAAMARLFITQRALEDARAALRKASIANKGGYVEKGRADIDQTIASLADALTYLNAHPEIDPYKIDPAQPMPNILPIDIPVKVRGGQPNMVAAGKALNAALEPLIDPAKGPPLNGLGGHRDKLLQGIARTSADVISGMYFGTPMGTGPATLPAAN